MNITKLEYILHYRAQGLIPIPLHDIHSGVCSCKDGAKCDSGGKHPRVNRQTAIDATEKEWKGWLKWWPHMNVGILTGSDTGVFVVDEDPRHGGDQSLAELIKKNGPLPKTVSASTGGGGKHYLFLIPGGMSISNSASELAPGIDIRGDGGLVVVQPSVTQGAYKWN
ncbi:MAG: bifunctional DNA primase/polymerase [Proteobacteria bacterium]|nr:bifunctional DNA primase/polymerase [Pseudomonadota bacterium]